MKREKPFFIIVLNEKSSEYDQIDENAENFAITNSFNYENHNEWKQEYEVIYKSYTKE